MNETTARKTSLNLPEETLGVTWSLLEAGNPLITMPRAGVIRAFTFSHLIHHRAHLLVYLRLNDNPVTGMNGPSGDEP